jgi:diaminopimelate dehydrogenase
MRRFRCAVIGFGKLGRACARAILDDDQLLLAGIVRRPHMVSQQLPALFEHTPTVAHISELESIDVALICVPAGHVLGIAHDLMQRRIPVAECAILHGEAYEQHKDELDRYAKHFKVAAIVGAGWDPGALSLFRNCFALLTPKGHTEVTRRPGVSLHHTTINEAIPGVKDALETTTHTGQKQRYVYVELEQWADHQQIEAAIKNDPLYLDEDTLVFPVDSVTTLEDEGHGLVMERRGIAAGIGHQLFLLEARYSATALAAEMMCAAARATATCRHRAYSLCNLPLAALWGDLRQLMEEQFI